MPARRLLNQRCAKHLLSRSFPFPVGPRASWLVVALFITPLVIPLHAQQKTKLPRPRRLDEDLALRRDPATGELTSTPAAGSAATNANKDATSTRPIAVVTQIVPVMCNVVGADGAAVGGLQRDDFRVFDDGAPSQSPTSTPPPNPPASLWSSTPAPASCANPTK